MPSDISNMSAIKKNSKDSSCISDSEDSFNMSKNEIKLDKNVRVSFKKFSAMNFIVFIMYENTQLNKTPIAKHKHLIELLITNDKFKHYKCMALELIDCLGRLNKEKNTQ